MKIRNLALFLLCIFCFSVLIPGTAFAEGPDVASEGAILVDYNTGTVLFEKNADKKLYPASTTKVMTGILAIENLNPDDIVTISQTAIDVDRDGSNMGLLWNEEISILDLIYGLLVHSANDAANALAENVSGTIADFVVLMNNKAAELGMKNTHFANTHGYHDDNHYTTPQDLAILCRYAMQNELFRQVVATAQYEIAPTNKYDEVRYLSSNNALINPNKGRTHLYSAAKGIKTGHTSVAGACLTSYAEQDGMKLVAVTMKAPSSSESFVDTTALLKYGFSNFKYIEIANTSEVICTHKIKWAKGDDHAVVCAVAPVYALLPKNYDEAKLIKTYNLPEDAKAPVSKGEILGTVTYEYDGKIVAEQSLTVNEDVKRSFFSMIFGSILSFIINKWLMFPLGIIAAFVLIKRYIAVKKAEEMRRRRKNRNRQEFYR